MVLLARETGFKSVFVPKDNAFEASVAEGIDIYAAESVSQILDHFTMRTRIEKQPKFIPENKPETIRLIFQMSKVKKQPKQLLKLPQLEDIMHFLSVLPEAEKVCWQSECLLYFRK